MACVWYIIYWPSSDRIYVCESVYVFVYLWAPPPLNEYIARGSEEKGMGGQAVSKRWGGAKKQNSYTQQKGAPERFRLKSEQDADERKREEKRRAPVQREECQGAINIHPTNRERKKAPRPTRRAARETREQEDEKTKEKKQGKKKERGDQHVVQFDFVLLCLVGSGFVSCRAMLCRSLQTSSSPLPRLLRLSRHLSTSRVLEKESINTQLIQTDPMDPTPASGTTTPSL